MATLQQGLESSCRAREETLPCGHAIKLDHIGDLRAGKIHLFNLSSSGLITAAFWSSVLRAGKHIARSELEPLWRHAFSSASLCAWKREELHIADVLGATAYI